MKVETIQTNFSAGEFAPALFGRTDIAQYSNACATVENFLVRPYGTLISTPGTEYVNACKTGGSTGLVRLINFIFSRTDAYVIEMGVGYFRFYNNGAVVVSPGTTAYEIAHTYAESELKDIQYAQINDVIYITHPNHPPAKLTRYSATRWALTDFGFIGGPFAPDNLIYSGGTTSILSSATITPSATSGNITLSASSNIFIQSSSTLNHKFTYWKIGDTITDSTTALAVQGYVQITAITNPSTATATVIKNLKSTSATTTWAQGSWSDVLGWPSRVTFHQQRLCFANTTIQPQNIWGSKPFTYEDFGVNGGADDDSLDIQLASSESNPINWLASGDTLVAGTYGGDFAIRSGDDSPLTPANTNAFKVTSWGSEPIQPKRIGNLFYYVQRFARKLREFFYDSYSTQNNRSVDMTILSPHIAVTGFKELAYQQNPDTVLWGLCSDGTIATFTREIDQQIMGWARQTTDGVYESITHIPSYAEPFNHDEIWVVVKRTINGSSVRYIERFKSQIVPDRQDECFYVHSGLTYDAYDATSNPAIAMSFTYPNATTKLLMHCDGDDGSTSFIDSAAGKTISVFGSAQIVQDTKKFGTGSLLLQNVLGNDSYTKLLLHLDNNVTDSSSSAKTVTNTSVTFDSANQKLGSYAGVFDGSLSFLSVPDSADWDFGSGDWTIDFWYRQSSDVSASFLGQYVDADNYWTISYNNINSYINCNFKVSGAFSLGFTFNIIFQNNVWTHIAIARSGNTYYAYINGVSQPLTLNNGSYSSSLPDLSAPLYIGWLQNGFFANGLLDEVRVSKGIARWTSDFTVPLYPYSSTADYLTLADSADWNFGTGDFTLDGWVNLNDKSNGAYILGQYADANNLWYLYKDTNDNGNKLRLYFKSTTVKADYVMTPTWGSLSINTWNHIAAVRSSSTVKIYINGVSQSLTATTPISTNDVGDVASVLTIGQQNSSGYLNGYIDELRIMKGIPYWTTDFTPPTSEGTQSGTVALVTTSSGYFSASSVGKRIRTIDANGSVDGEITVSGYTSSTIVVGTLSKDLDSFNYAGGLWGVSVSSISGLNHLEAKTVSVLGDGVKDTPNKVVSNGTISLIVDRFTANIGLPYTQKIVTLAQEAGSQRGTSQGKIQRINQVSLKVNRSYDGFKIGGDSDSLDTLVQASPSLYTGTIANINFEGDYEYGATIDIENPDPLPIELLSIISSIDTNDK